MTQIMHDTTSAQDMESRLWAEYLVTLARKDECWRLYLEAWHSYVLTGLDDDLKGRVWEKSRSLQNMWREREIAAYDAWMRVAYPLHGIPLRDEDNASV